MDTLPRVVARKALRISWPSGGGREIMAIRHRELPVYGVQFHPESFLTPDGHEILKAFLATTRGSVSI